MKVVTETDGVPRFIHYLCGGPMRPGDPRGPGLLLVSPAYNHEVGLWPHESVLMFPTFDYNEPLRDWPDVP